MKVLVIRVSLCALTLALALCLFLPFVTRTSEAGETLAYSGVTMLNGDDDVYVGEQNVRKKLGRADDAYLYALILVAAVVSAGGCALGWRSRSIFGIALCAGLAALASAVALCALTPQSYALSEEFGGAGFRDALAWGMIACVCLSGALSLLGAAGLVLEKSPKRANATPLLARIGVLGAIAAALYYIPGIPVVPPIYKLDFSTVPVLLAGFSMGPVPALFVLLIKDLTGLLSSSSMGVGELADFVASGAMAVVASLFYRRRKTFARALIGMILGILVMTVAASAMNYWVLIPFYVQVLNMPLETIVTMIGKTIPAVDTLEKLILWATVPFNLLKGAVLCVITTVLYKRLSHLLK